MATILFFGKLADLAGTSQLQHDGNVPFSKLIEDLSGDRPELAHALNLPSNRAALNLSLVPIGADPHIGPNDELAFMPPVSGG